MSKLNYIIRDPKGLNTRFYERYDELFLLRKAYTLLLIADRPEAFKQFVKEAEDSEELVDNRYTEALRAEIHFSEFLQFEAFFALLIAGFQPLPHWLYLTTYSTWDLKAKITAFLNGDIANVTSGRIRSPKEFVDTAIYDSFRPDDPDKIAHWDLNIDNILWFVRRIARKFIDGPEYNAYKHGLRIITGPTYFRLYPTGEPEKGFTHASDDSIRYLELEPIENNQTLVREAFKHFSPEESINHIFFMSSILETVRAVRLARLKSEPGAKLNTFISLDRENITNLTKGTKWSLPT